MFFYEPDKNPNLSGSDGGCGLGLDDESLNHVLMKNTFFHIFKRTDISEDKRAHGVGKLLLHEMLHSLGLHHMGVNSQNNLFQSDEPIGAWDNLTNANTCAPGFDQNCSNNIMTRLFNYSPNGLSPLQLAHVHRLLIGSWKSKQLKVDFDQTKSIEISQDETWDHGRVIYGNITVAPGARLTINCKVIMPPGGTINVYPGGELIIDGGLVTIASSKCGDYWTGIRAIGRNNVSQSPNSQGNLEQAYVEIINEGTIAFSERGIFNVDEETFEDGGGAVIKCTGAEFLNNRTSVDLNAYTIEDNITMEDVIVDNVSEFIECTFTVNDDHIWGTKHVRLHEVSGIYFRGCDFLNEKKYVGGEGIDAMDAHFVVEDYCVPSAPCPTPGDFGRSLFSRLYRGIDVSASNHMFTYSVDRSDFVNNAIGINSNAVQMPLIVRNNFVVGGEELSSTNVDIESIGVRINGGTGYTVEENDFLGQGRKRERRYVGILVRETGGDDNEIRRNTFDELYVGNLSNGVNRGSGTFDSGLRYSCNINLGNNIFDFCVPNEPLSPNFDYGIAQNQGSNAEPTGNEFSYNGNNSESDFLNQSPNEIFYFHAFGQAPVDFTFGNFSPIPTQNNNICNIDFPQIIGPNPQGESEARENYRIGLEARALLLETLGNNIDGGNTYLLLSQIAQATSANSNQLVAMLNSNSPWLSKEVLKATADRSDIISHSEMYDLLMANPDIGKSPEMLNYMSSALSPMPASMINSISESPFLATVRTELEATISTKSISINAAAVWLTRYFMVDPINKNRDSVKVWLPRQEGIQASMAMVDFWLHNSDLSQASLALNNIPENHQMSQNQQLEFNYFRNLKNIQIELAEQGKTVFDLVPANIQSIIDIANNSKGLAGRQAKNILNHGFDFSIFDPTIFPESTEERLQNTTLEEEKNRIVAFPNPATDKLSFEYHLDREYSNIVIKIY
ncbi:MAG: hypothetical protein ACI9XB_005146, partial [Gammaproteobacteria bacterium]